MVNTQTLIEHIRTVYQNTIGDSIVLLMLGGSLGRGNFINGWSDVDLLLVLRTTTHDILLRVARAEREISERWHVAVDTVTVPLNTIVSLPAGMLDGKVQNFLYTAHDGVVLINTGVALPSVAHSVFVDALAPQFAEQEKRFYRRCIDAAGTDDKRAILQKNIKIIFLVLRRVCATRGDVPSTYESTIAAVRRHWPEYDTTMLRWYAEMRHTNALAALPPAAVARAMRDAVEEFQRVSALVQKELLLCDAKSK